MFQDNAKEFVCYFWYSTPAVAYSYNSLMIKHVVTISAPWAMRAPAREALAWIPVS